MHPFLVSCVILKTLWWRGKDSNLRSQWRQIYSLFPLTAREPLRNMSYPTMHPAVSVNRTLGYLFKNYLRIFRVLRVWGAGDGNRTRNLLITNQLLCH